MQPSRDRFPLRTKKNCYDIFRQAIYDHRDVIKLRCPAAESTNVKQYQVEAKDLFDAKSRALDDQLTVECLG